MPNPSARGLANLRPFRSGQSGNPKGRPKGSGTLKMMLRAALDACPPGSEKTYAEKVVERIVQRAGRHAEYALKLFKYLEPPTRVVEATVGAEECATEALLARLEVLADVHLPTPEDEVTVAA
jgi:hypothetical protein